MPSNPVRRRCSLFAALPLLLLTACGSGNPDSMVGKDINMNAIVDTNATADTNAEEAQYPQASNAAETRADLAPKVDRAAAERAATNTEAEVPDSGQDEPPATDQPTADTNSQ